MARGHPQTLQAIIEESRENRNRSIASVAGYGFLLVCEATLALGAYRHAGSIENKDVSNGALLLIGAIVGASLYPCVKSISTNIESFYRNTINLKECEERARGQ
jgi:hypothetical protein